MQTLRIFISSPGDVSQERERASQVIQSLQRRYSRKLHLIPVFWENLPLEPDMSFQQGIDLFLKNPGVDVAVFILWSRLGSPLGASLRKADGSAYRSGTEREYDLMIQARAQSRAAEGVARPRVIIYTRRDDNSFDARLRGKTTAEKKEMISQKELVESFMKETFKDAETGENIGAYHPFDRPVTFSQRLRTHLVAILDELAGDMDEVIWDIEKQGPPFLGLEAFQPEHADVFCGRDEEILEARNALKHQAANGCAFLLLSGASGSGKSSLARAGILPEILAHEPDEEAEIWKSLIITPSELGTDPILGLLTRLSEKSLLPELLDQIPSLEKAAIALTKDASGFFDFTFPKAFQAAESRLGGTARFLLVIDQLEEIFTKDALTKETRAAFLALLETFARSGRFWLIATVRSDFYQEIQSEPALVRMKEGRGLLDVLPPQPDAIARLIEEPARLAGLSFEEKDGQPLSTRILRDAAHSPELLPLLEFVLLELFNQDKDKHQLTHATYDSLGGVEGALRRKAETTYNSLTPEAQATLPKILQSLVTLGDDTPTGGESDKPVRLRAPLSTFSENTPARELIAAFTAARLFTTAGSGTVNIQGEATAEPTVTVAHESLLRVWPRAIQWKESNIDFLRTRSRIAARIKEGSPLLKGDPLLETAKAFLISAPEGFSSDQREWIQASLAQAEAKERQATTRRRFAFAALSLLTLLAVAGAIVGWRATLDANDQRNEAKKQSRKAEKQTEVAVGAKENADLARREAEKNLGRILVRAARDETTPFTRALLATKATGFVDPISKKATSPQSPGYIQPGDESYLEALRYVLDSAAHDRPHKIIPIDNVLDITWLDHLGAIAIVKGIFDEEECTRRETSLEIWFPPFINASKEFSLPQAPLYPPTEKKNEDGSVSIILDTSTGFSSLDPESGTIIQLPSRHATDYRHYLPLSNSILSLQREKATASFDSIEGKIKTKIALRDFTTIKYWGRDNSDCSLVKIANTPYSAIYNENTKDLMEESELYLIEDRKDSPRYFKTSLPVSKYQTFQNLKISRSGKHLVWWRENLPFDSSNYRSSILLSEIDWVNHTVSNPLVMTSNITVKDICFLDENNLAIGLSDSIHLVSIPEFKTWRLDKSPGIPLMVSVHKEDYMNPGPTLFSTGEKLATFCGGKLITWDLKNTRAHLLKEGDGDEVVQLTNNEVVTRKRGSNLVSIKTHSDKSSPHEELTYLASGEITHSSLDPTGRFLVLGLQPGPEYNQVVIIDRNDKKDEKSETIIWEGNTGLVGLFDRPFSFSETNSLFAFVRHSEAIVFNLETGAEIARSNFGADVGFSSFDSNSSVLWLATGRRGGVLGGVESRFPELVQWDFSQKKLASLNSGLTSIIGIAHHSQDSTITLSGIQNNTYFAKRVGNKCNIVSESPIDFRFTDFLGLSQDGEQIYFDSLTKLLIATDQKFSYSRVPVASEQLGRNTLLNDQGRIITDRQSNLYSYKISIPDIQILKEMWQDGTLNFEYDQSKIIYGSGK